jgi:hypothetical protein
MNEALRIGHILLDPFVKQYGTYFTPSPLPSKYRMGPLGGCYKNSYRMALRHRVTYVEGFAIADPNVHYVQSHAWCCDSDGRVLDRTWPPAAVYFGIPIQTKFLRRLLTARQRKWKDRMYYGVLDDYLEHHPLISQFGDKPELWLAQVGFNSQSAAISPRESAIHPGP